MEFSGPRRAALLTVSVTLLVVLATASLVVAVSGGDRGGAPPPPQSGPHARIAPRAVDGLAIRDAVASLAVLRNWDAARSRAWARGSTAALRALYAPGSRAGARDLAMLRAWRRRGLTVQGMEMQVLSVELWQRTERRIVLVVTDRLVGAVAVGRGGRRALPRDRSSSRRLGFERRDGRWRLREVYDERGTESASSPASPEASTDSTSGSANR
ncbi:hypothetical protein [Nocardioides sambongensis]|uniref:hypothetical protein n=1 Tax=Nocardioides sambongensis TaxID=2589074 RepID=UPI00112E2B46|nr:hypothetical protein [Nocardioides sambongensis]